MCPRKPRLEQNLAAKRSRVANAIEFQQRVQQLGKLIAELEQIPDSPLKVGAEEMFHLLMEIHGTGIERMMEIVSDTAGAGPELIDKLGNDPIIRSLLLLYSLHPEELQTRVLKSLDALRPRLRKLDCGVELISIEEGRVHLKVGSSGHACSSTMENLRSMIEEGVYEYAPDVTSLVIRGLEAKPSSGFVALDSLVGSDTVHTSASQPLAVGGGD
jgi:Fe-S cluster biogenesis protein NfuA